MYVCSCFAVTDLEVERAIEGGARTVDAVTRACRAGGDCGACRGQIDCLIEDHLDAQESSGPVLVAPAALVRPRVA